MKSIKKFIGKLFERRMFNKICKFYSDHFDESLPKNSIKNFDSITEKILEKYIHMDDRQKKYEELKLKFSISSRKKLDTSPYMVVLMTFITYTFIEVFGKFIDKPDNLTQKIVYLLLGLFAFATVYFLLFDAIDNIKHQTREQFYNLCINTLTKVDNGEFKLDKNKNIIAAKSSTGIESLSNDIKQIKKFHGISEDANQ